jgi:hypothetical protein
MEYKNFQDIVDEYMKNKDRYKYGHPLSKFEPIEECPDYFKPTFLVIDKLLNNCDVEEKRAFIKSFLDFNGSHYHAKMFELIVLNILKKNFPSVEIEPQKNGPNPDFIVQDKQNKKFIFELTKPLLDEKNWLTEQRKNKIFKSIQDKLTKKYKDDKNIVVEIIHFKYDNLDFNNNDLIHKLDEKIHKLKYENTEYQPLKLDYERKKGNNDIQIKFEIFFSTLDLENKIEVREQQISFEIDNPKQIRQKLNEKKARQNVDKTIPYIICLNMSSTSYELNESEALFGNEAVSITGKSTIRPNGFFLNENNKIVSAVWIFRALD